MTVRASPALKTLGLVTLFTLLVPSAPRLLPAVPGGDARPNIVLVMADDLDVRLGTMEYTPYIRALLQHQGTTFDNALVPVSLCCPSRVSLLRGQYVHNHQVYTNGPPDGGFQKALATDLEDSTLATVLQAAGYRTALAGKYLNGYPLTDTLTYIPPGWDEFYSPSSDAAYLGFNYTMNLNGTLVPFGNAPEDYMTDVLARLAVSFITRTVTSDQPFFLYISTYAPHGPATPAPRHANLFNGVTAPRGGSFNELDMSDKPPLISQLPLILPPEIAEMDEKYRNRLRSMQAVDEMVALLIATLQNTGELSNTYFVFTSDNGYHLGQHRLPAGKYTNYEEDLRIPLIMRGPGVPISQTSTALVSTMDLFPTFAELAQTAAPAYVDGRSLLGLLAGASPWRQVFFLEQYPFSSNIGDDPSLRNGLLEPDEPDQPWHLPQPPASLCNSTVDPKPIYTGIRGTRYKYVEHHACDRELYDLESDPYELNNLYAQASPETQAQLDAWLRVMESCAAGSCRAFELAPPFWLLVPFVYR
jgi:arylsulfatase A-like enzyme